jgi:hypothetical protein
MVTAAASAPVAVGAKWPWMVHSAPAARLVPQLLRNTNEDASPPVRAILEIVKAAVPVFVKVTDCELLDMPTSAELYQRLVDDRVTVCADKATGKQQVNREQTKILDTRITSAHVLAYVSHSVSALLLGLRRIYDGAAPTSTGRRHFPACVTILVPRMTSRGMVSFDL